MSYLDQKIAEQRYAADRAAEAARRDAEAAKAAQLARVMSQGNAGLASKTADPYVSGISAEDAYKLKLAQDAAFNNAARQNYNDSRQYVEDGKVLANQHWDTPAAYDAAIRSDKFDSKVDQGLAAKWLADRANFK